MLADGFSNYLISLYILNYEKIIEHLDVINTFTLIIVPNKQPERFILY